MSKFLERLDRINRGATTTTMGFGAASSSETVPSMALLGILKDGKKLEEEASVLASIGADGAIIDLENSEQIIKKMPNIEGLPWGVRAEDINADKARDYKEKGCDFIGLDPSGADVEALIDEDMGYLLYIQPDIDDRSLRGIEDLPVDAVVVPLQSNGSPLTLESLIKIGSVRTMLSGYLLLEVAEPRTPWELKVLKDMGVDGLVVNASSGEILKDLKESLTALPKRQRTRGARPSPLLPQGGYSLGQAPSQDDDGDDDEF